MLTTRPYTPQRRRLAIAARHLAEPRLTQRDLAAVLDVSPALVALVETGDRRPSVDLARRWAQALAQPPERIFPDVFSEKSDGAAATAPVATPDVDAGDGGADEA